jgi:hypothetical protein
VVGADSLGEPKSLPRPADRDSGPLPIEKVEKAPIDLEPCVREPIVVAVLAVEEPVDLDPILVPSVLY